MRITVHNTAGVSRPHRAKRDLKFRDSQDLEKIIDGTRVLLDGKMPTSVRSILEMINWSAYEHLRSLVAREHRRQKRREERELKLQAP